MKKHISAFILAAALTASLAACGTVENSSAPESKTELTTSDTPENEATEANTEAPTEESTEAPTESPTEAEDLYKQFLDGKVEAKIGTNSVVDLSYICVQEADFEDGELSLLMTYDGESSLSISELTKAVTDTPDHDFNGMKVDYAVMDTNFGNQALVLYYEGINLFSGAEGVYCYFVIEEIDGELQLVYAADGWSRNLVSVLDGLVFSRIGSNGAGDSSGGLWVIDDKGYRLIYSDRTLIDAWVAMYAYEAFTDASTWTNSGATLYVAETEKGKFYSLEQTDKVDQADIDKLEEYLKDEGIKKVDSVPNLEKETLDSFGIDYSSLTEFDDWKYLN